MGWRCFEGVSKGVEAHRRLHTAQTWSEADIRVGVTLRGHSGGTRGGRGADCGGDWDHLEWRAGEQRNCGPQPSEHRLGKRGGEAHE